MNTITVDKAKLMQTLVENRAKHRDTYFKAIEVYRAKAIEIFEEQLEALKAGKLPERSLRLPLPEEHTADYDRAVEMLHWHEGDTVELTEREFAQYVQDDWGWRQTFTANTTSYVQM